MIIVSVMYGAGERFDEDYYFSHHMPLVLQHWGEHIADARVLRGVGAGGGGAPAYQVIAELSFASHDAMQAAMAGPHAAEIMGDIPNFTSAQPVVQISEVAG